MTTVYPDEFVVPLQLCHHILYLTCIQPSNANSGTPVRTPAITMHIGAPSLYIVVIAISAALRGSLPRRRGNEWLELIHFSVDIFFVDGVLLAWITTWYLLLNSLTIWHDRGYGLLSQLRFRCDIMMSPQPREANRQIVLLVLDRQVLLRLYPPRPLHKGLSPLRH